jgi:hypothetical protein
MPTGPEIKVLLRPLLSRRPDLVLKGRLVFFAPFTHYLRGVGFDYTKFDGNGQLYYFVNHLCNGNPGVNMIEWRGAFRFKMNDSWDRDRERTSRALCDELEHWALPVVEPIIDFAEQRKRMPETWKSDGSLDYYFAHALGYCTVGNFDAAEEMTSKLYARLISIPRLYSKSEFPDGIRHHEAWQWRMAHLHETLRTDRSQVLPLLHEWEEISVGLLKLMKHWKPTPFPCEL